MHKYAIKYDLTPEYGNFTAEEIESENKGGCDAFIFASILYPEDGSLSVDFVSKDKVDNPLAFYELFKIWTLMGAAIADGLKEEGDQFRSEIASLPIEMMREMILSTRKKEAKK